MDTVRRWTTSYLLARPVCLWWCLVINVYGCCYCLSSLSTFLDIHHYWSFCCCLSWCCFYDWYYIPILALFYKLTFCWKQKVVACLQVWQNFYITNMFIFFLKIEWFFLYWKYCANNMFEYVHARITCKLETLIATLNFCLTLLKDISPSINLWTLCLHNFFFFFWWKMNHIYE